MTTQIEVLLPLKPRNGERGSDLARVRDALLPSFNRFCDPGFVARFTIVVPDADLAAVSALQEASHLHLEIIGEQTLLGDPPQMPWRGWYLQQMLKIAYCGICRTPWYLTLDADCFLTDFLDARVLLQDRAPAHMETVADHPGWWPASAAALHARPATLAEPVLGVTPAFLSAEIMRRVTDRLGRIAAGQGRSWIDYLAALATVTDQTWTEYALYWTTLINTDTADRVHHSRPTYVFCQSLPEARSAIRVGALGNGPLFGVLQSAFVTDAAHVAFVSRLLRDTEPPSDPRRKRGLHGGYHHVHPARQREMLAAGGDLLLVSASANADGLAAALGMKARWPLYDLLCRLPIPPALPECPDLRMIYVIDEPAAAVLAMADGRQSDVCKTNNINFPPAVWDDLTAESYLGGGQDVLNLYEHVRNWTDPDGPLRLVAGKVLILRLSQLEHHIQTIVDYVDPTAQAAGSLRRKLLQIRVHPHDPARREWMAPLYGPLCAYIDAFPGAALWDGAAGALFALDAPPFQGQT